MMRRIETALFAAVCAVVFVACSACGGKDNPNGPVSKTSQFFLPTGEPRNTGDPHIQADAQGNFHIVYPAYSRGDAYYAFCPSNCSSVEQAKVVHLETQGTVDNARVAVGPDGKPQVLLSTHERVYYATCSGDCTQRASWTVTPIIEHGGEREVSGDAFAVTPQGKPRFIMHSYRSIGIGAPTPATFYVQCDNNCQNPASWTQGQISARNWQMNSLRFTPSGQPRLVKAELVDGGNHLSYYYECDTDCASAANWKGTALYKTFYGFSEAVRMYPAMSLRLSSQGKPRLALMGDDGSGRNLLYLECDTNCTSAEGWFAQILLPSDKGGAELKAGLELALDSKDQPRIAYAAGYNIVIAHCDANCTDETKSKWNLAKVEFAADMEKDKIIPYPDCNIAGGWFLHSPSIALGKEGLPRVAYRAQDISGGGSNPGPGEIKCTAGADMTFARFAQIDELRAP
ncbi:hypothetical protein D187_000072 [Cystobacter fuscus DSM 2262]|uniref:Lipoprotein n=1 Tax=Cystobacter fuscus (strain ATCC 25194 / DSM 2262 / NBRC 100088 / M29) TaxID=1242864 RepID=S9PK94_CYSF2|nr:hypothetical protein [Cystobacter fuscus]EPX64650.1 hypothetical protein D187_000072 [Cystobacter fuscus DSM 2262]